MFNTVWYLGLASLLGVVVLVAEKDRLLGSRIQACCGEPAKSDAAVADVDPETDSAECGTIDEAGVCCTPAESSTLADTEKIACTLGERDLANRIVQTQQQLSRRATRVIELENGYRWEYPSDDDAVLRELSEWIIQERKCCSFFRFALTIEPNGPTSLAVTGKPGVKDFIVAAMKLKRRR